MVRSLQVEYLEINWTFFLNFCNFYHSTLGGIQQLHGQNFAIVCPPPPPGWTIFIPWAWTKQTFFDPLPHSSCPRCYWMPPYWIWSRIGSRVKISHYVQLVVPKGMGWLWYIWHLSLIYSINVEKSSRHSAI